MVSDPVGTSDDLASVLARVRAEVEEAGEFVHDRRPPTWEPAIEPEDRELLVKALRDGTYAEEVAEIGRIDPELAD